MSIVHRGGSTDTGSKTSFTPTEDASSAEDDFMLLIGFISDIASVWTAPADFTELDQFSETAGTPDSQVYIGYKRRGATSGNGYNLSYGGSAANGGVLLTSYSGVDTTTPFDVTYVKATHYDTTLNDENAAANAITTVNADAMVVLLQMMTSNAVTAFAAPTSFNQRTAAGSASGNVYSCDQLTTTAGIVTPSVYGHTGNATQDQRQFTVSLKAVVTSPVVESSTTEQFSTAANAHLVDMPATVDAGDLLLLLFSNDGNFVPTTPSGWTELDTEAIAGAGQISIYAKDAIGDEDSTTVDCNTSTITTAASIIYRISSWGGTLGTDVDIALPVTETTTTPNPPSVTAGWGADDNLFIAIVGTANDNVSASSGPSGWTNLVTVNAAGPANDGPGVHSAQLASTNAAEDPGTFTLSASQTCESFTLVIKPAAASSIASIVVHHLNQMSN